MSIETQKVDLSLTQSALTLPASASVVSADQSAALLMRADYRAKSAWTEHLPFAFWVIQALRPRSLVELGTHLGTSYFGFCQAVARFGTDTACYAIDTWQGDEHAGFYGDDVFNTVTAYNTANFSGFSTLVRSTFEEAAPYFSEGSIDLLHIDGCHSYEAVRKDFESWLPMLSDRGLVLMHDTNVRERDFGVFRFLEELRSDYPVFEFRHGHGLGVVGVGSDLPDEILDLLAASDASERSRDIRKIFSRLGEDCRTRSALDGMSTETERLEGIIGRERDRIKALEERLTVLQDSNASLKAHHEKVHSSLKEEHAKSQSTLQDEISRLQQKAEELIGENRTLSARVDEMNTLLDGSEAEIGARDLLVQSKTDENTRLHAELSTLTRRLVELKASQEKFMQDASQTSDHRSAESTDSYKVRSDAQKRIDTVIQNAAELIGVFAPDHPSRTSILRSSRIRALTKRVEAEHIVDAEWYLRQNPDVKEAGMAPAKHYVLYGAAEKRLPRDMSKPIKK